MDKEIDGVSAIVILLVVCCIVVMVVTGIRCCNSDCNEVQRTDSVFIPIKDDQAILELQRKIDSLESIKLKMTEHYESQDPVDPDSAYLEFLRHVSKYRLDKSSQE